MNICFNQSSCVMNLKPFLFSPNKDYIPKCRTIKLKSIRVNYTCVNDSFTLNNIRNQSKKNYTILLCLSILIIVSLFALICSYFRQFPNSTITENIQIADHPSKQEYELKNFVLVESSSSSTLTSLNNKNLITNPSEYDNLIKTTFQLTETKS
jgi:predicted negative regulator of RcsB-dependent stress response